MSMVTDPLATWMISQETRALLTRLARVKPFVLYETMVPAAALSPSAQTAIEMYLARGRHELQGATHRFLSWLHSHEGRHAPPAEAQRRFTFLRLRFNTTLDEFDIFADVVTQRSESDNGVWLAGLDAAAADALALPGGYYQAPPVICYLDRGHGAAIRRARTRLPSGEDNPVAVIRVPRERMVGSGIASSLVHEVGHQGAALLDLINSLRPALRARHESEGEQSAWGFWERWISEIVSDLWSVARVGVAGTLGLMGVVSLPRPFLFRVSMDDPHPIPWIRVKLSATMGNALYPHPQWGRLLALWEALYPRSGLNPEREELFVRLEDTMTDFVELLVQHRPRALLGRTLGEALTSADRRPESLVKHYQRWRASPAAIRATPPTLAFAIIGQAKMNGQISPEAESRLIGDLLTYWAMRTALDLSSLSAKLAQSAAPALVA